MPTRGEERLSENFHLLLEVNPDDRVLPFVKQDMFEVWNNEEFHIIMMYILDFINPAWHTEFNFPINVWVDSRFHHAQQHEKTFRNLVCGSLNNLRKEFPDEGMTFITPSSLAVFSGKKARDFLTKTTNALLSLYIKRGKAQFDDPLDENVDALEEACSKLENEVKALREGPDHLVELQTELDAEKMKLTNIVGGGGLEGDVKARLLNLDDSQVFADCYSQYEKKLVDLKPLKNKLQEIEEGLKPGHNLEMNKELEKRLWKIAEDTTKTEIARLKGEDNVWLFKYDEPCPAAAEWLEENLRVASGRPASGSSQPGPFTLPRVTAAAAAARNAAHSTAGCKSSSLSLTPILNQQEILLPKEEVKVEVPTLAGLLRPLVVNIPSSPSLKSEPSYSRRRPRTTLHTTVKKLHETGTPHRRMIMSSSKASTVIKSEAAGSSSPIGNQAMQVPTEPTEPSPMLPLPSALSYSPLCLESSSILDQEVASMLRAEHSEGFDSSFISASKASTVIKSEAAGSSSPIGNRATQVPTEPSEPTEPSPMLPLPSALSYSPLCLESSSILDQEVASMLRAEHSEGFDSSS